MNGDTQFNQILLDFIEFVPFTCTRTERSSDSQISLPANFFDVYSFTFGHKEFQVKWKQHLIRLDEKQKPKNFFTLEVLFSKSGSVMELERLYGDFRRLHEYVVATFENELREYESIERATSQGEIKEGKQVAIAPLSSTYGVAGKDEGGSIVLNKRTSEEFYDYGRVYMEEAKRILESLPTFPSKFLSTEPGQ
jgi:hypothetical protein